MFKNRSRTLLNIALYIGITMLVVVVFLSGSLYVIAEKEGLDFARQSNSELLGEVSYHLSYINQVNTNFCSTQFNDNDVQSILTAEETGDLFNVNQTMRRIGKALSLNEMVQSVVLYNGRADAFYSTVPQVLRQSEAMGELLKNDKESATFFIVPHKIYNEITNEYDKETLAYVMAERNPRTNDIQTAVVVNISTKWMLANLAAPGNTQSGRLMLMRNDGRILLDAQNDTTEERFFDGELLLTMQQGKGDSFVRQIDGAQTVISYQYVQGTDWILLNLQPYDTLLSFARMIKNKMVFAMLLSLLLGLMITMLIARLIYRPFGTLFHHISAQYAQEHTKNSPELSPAGDTAPEKEFDFLLGVFDKQKQQLQKLEDYKWSSENQLRKSRLKTVLLENGTQAYPPLFHFGDEESGMFRWDEDIMMAVLVISNFHNIAANNISERNLIRFAVSNIAEELMQQYGPVEAVHMSGGEVVLLVRAQTGAHDFTLCKHILKEIADNVYSILNLTLSVFMDTARYNSCELSQCYRNLQQLSRYTLIYDVRCILMAEELAEQQKKALEYPQEIEKKLFEALSCANSEATTEQLRTFIRTICEGSVESYLACVTKLELALQSYVKQINTHKLIKIQVDFQTVFSQIQYAETSEQIYHQLSILIHTIIEQTPYSPTRKNEAIIETIQEYIEAHFSDKELCGKMLAGNFDISTAYMGMLFKESTGCSVQEYINRIRLEHAHEMVLGTNLQIAQIVELCGLETSSFYRLYKTYFGVSPKEQRIGARLQSESQEESNKE